MVAIARIVAPLAERDARKGIYFMGGGLALFSILNGVVKAQAVLFPLNQIIFFRNAFALISLVVLMQLMGGKALLVTKRPRAQLWQAFCFTLVLFFMFYAYQRMPLAEATAISFLQPLIVMLLSAPMLGERVSLSQWAAVAVGLVGVMLMVQPTGSASPVGAAAAGLATALSALSLIQQRDLSRTDDTLTIVFYTMLFSALMLLPTLAWAWVAPNWVQLLGLIAMGLASGFCQYLTTRAVFFAPVASIAPIGYTKMLWAILIGYVWFGDVPTVWVLIGLGIVMAATLIVVRRPAMPGERVP